MVVSRPRPLCLVSLTFCPPFHLHISCYLSHGIQFTHDDYPRLKNFRFDKTSETLSFHPIFLQVSFKKKGITFFPTTKSDNSPQSAFNLTSVTSSSHQP